MSSREGGSFFDPTKNLTPAGARRARERFTNQIKTSEERIRELKRKREEIISRLDEKIEREQTYIQEAHLVLQMIEDSFGEDYDGYDVDPDSEIIESDGRSVKVIKDNGDYEIILYGTPIY